MPPNHGPNPNNPSVDPNTGFCSNTMTFHTLRSPAPLPPESAPLSVTDYVFSLLNSSPPPPTTSAFIDAGTRHRILYSDLILRTKNLVSSLRTKFGLSRGDSALIVSPNSIYTPILYFSLFSLGVAVSPANPVSTIPEIKHYVQLSKPAIAFATLDTAPKIPALRYGTVLVDSVEFELLMENGDGAKEAEGIEVSQSDVATILYSSGTTGRVKGVELTHRNWIATAASNLALRPVRETPPIHLCTVPLFHVYGFAYCVRAVAMGETVVIAGGGRRFGLGTMCGTIEEFRVSHVVVAPPVIVAMVRDGGVMDGYDLSSLEAIGCGGAPLRKGVIQKLRGRLPNVMLAQAYGLTETVGRVFSTMGRTECEVEGATGKLMPNCQAKIVDPETGAALPPSMVGELWLKGAHIMKGYIDDEEATMATLDSEGWFRTGDLCYIDKEGFLFFVDRIKELIKYKGYQVAPAELEHLLQSHPDVVEAAVVPFPDEESGQVPMAFVVKQSGSSICESQIKDFVAKQVAPYKTIRRLMFLDSLPKNATGKVLRKELIKMANAISKL
ncbi:hypothetical protein SLA2020_049580 [Shorea laevis]